MKKYAISAATIGVMALTLVPSVFAQTPPVVVVDNATLNAVTTGMDGLRTGFVGFLPYIIGGGLAAMLSIRGAFWILGKFKKVAGIH